MKRRYKILGGTTLFLAGALAILAAIVSRTDDCPTAQKAPSSGDSMRSVVYRCYGSPDVLELVDAEKPKPADDEVLVKIKAASVNPLDWHYMRGSPYIMRLEAGIGAPKDSRMGVDFAGIVESVGNNVTGFKPGDEVFGGGNGAFAGYITIADTRALAVKPDAISFAEAAAVPIAASTALQALRDIGRVSPGDRVLINGASGGVGTFAVQIAKHMGAEVTGVCSTRNVDMVRQLGADHVIDYKTANYTEQDTVYDVIIDNVGNHALLKNKRVLADDGIYVIVGAQKGDWLGPLIAPVKAFFLSPFVKPEMVMILAQLRQDDLVYLATLMSNGELKPVIDRYFQLPDTADAIRYSESGRARGKIIIRVDEGVRDAS